MVSILGGGIAGTVLGGALALRRYPVTVYERQPAPGTGAFLVLDAHAHRSLTELGVPLAALHAASHPLASFRFHYRPEGSDTGPARGQRLYERSALMRVLTDFAHSAGTDIRYGVGVSDIDPATGALRAADEELTGPGVVIAADGIDSLARARLEPDRTALYARQVVIYGQTTRAMDLPVDPAVMHFHGQLGEGPLPVSTFGYLWTETALFWFTRLTRTPVPVDDIGFHPTSEWANAIGAADPTATTLIETILAATDTIHVSNTRIVPLNNARPPATPLILCGDADHAITPAAVRGAREAIEDALALTKALAAGDSPARAMSERRAVIASERQEQARRAAAGAAAATDPEPDSGTDDFRDGMDPMTRMWFE
ncbi:hypothetical protein OHB26_38870 (plasmid) [Nocardia sp. NBC_01503]|uniref:FAD-dependent oxidoreductase n=1 Tax=Nocardia sp. NBC_01503 TaxID=2975997 RepID=UPI002E7BDD29|nr:NAD(P)-binding protein [Nocardia sp. NBC_01503]WTL36642.1 hypothetical protein OHB26_38870 [Nocardia sp. NBC_01503]